VGGILFSTVLTLFVVPVAYVLLDRLTAGRAAPAGGATSGGRLMLRPRGSAVAGAAADSLRP